MMAGSTAIGFSTREKLERARGASAALARISTSQKNALLLAIPGQAGVQRFFTAGDRPLCLYAVMAERPGAATALSELNSALLSLEILEL